MINTGYISFITESGGGYDANRNPIAPSKVNSDYLGCSLKIIKKEYLVLDSGQVTQARYGVYVDSDRIKTLPTPFYSTNVPPGDFIPDGTELILFAPKDDGTLRIDLDLVKEINLQGANKNKLGVFRVASIEFLNFTKRVKIIVV